MYRDILKGQMVFSKEMNAHYGNMTSQEKKMNRDDLLAYKNYERQQYALVPGFKQLPMDSPYRGVNLLHHGGASAKRNSNAGLN